MGRKTSVWVAGLCAVLLGALSATAEAGPASWRGQSVDAWRADLRFFAEQAPTVHKNLFHTVSPADFASAVAALDAKLPTLSDEERLAGIMRLCAMVEDGHSGVAWEDLALARVPLRFIEREDGVFVEAADGAHARLVGKKLTAVNGIPTEKALERLRPLLSHDPKNAEHVRENMPRYLSAPVALKGVGLSTSSDHATFTFAGPHLEAVTLEASVLSEGFSLKEHVLAPLPAGWVQVEGRRAATLAEGDADRYFFLRELPEKHALYVKLRAIQNDPVESFAHFAERVDQALVQQKPERVILDVRQSPGGDNTLLRPLLVALFRHAPQTHGGLWVLIGRRTFSATENFVNRLENYADPIFVGEPTGENVNFYGDPKHLELPRTHVPIALSSLWWQDKNPWDERTAMMPEVAVPMTFADLVAGKDRALDVALNEPAPRTLEAALRDAAPHGLAATRKAYDAYFDDPRHRYVADAERELNLLGYALAGENKLDAAIAVLQVNADTHPRSSNVFDSLGENLEAAHRTEDARRAYAQAVAVDPHNDHSKQALQRLSAR